MHDYKVEMGKRLKEKRKALGLTQEQLAEKLIFLLNIMAA